MYNYHNALGNQFYPFPSAYFPIDKPKIDNKNKGKELASIHDKHEGFRRIKGRIYCRSCDNKRNRERKAYHRHYQRRLRRKQGRPSNTPVFDQFIDWSQTAGGLYTVKHLAAALGVSRNTVASWVRRKWLDSFIQKNRTKSGAWRSRVVIEV